MYYYQQTLLYTYPKLNENAEQLDKMVLYKALTSWSTTKNTFTQIEKINELNSRKTTVLVLKNALDKILSSFTKQEIELVERRFFNKIKSTPNGMNNSSYYRKIVSILKKFAKAVEKEGIGEDWFLKYCRNIWFLESDYSRRKALYLSKKQKKEEELVKVKKEA